jgi:aspartate dehydrogenase
MRTPPPRFAVIGFGAITEEIVRCLEARGALSCLLGVLDLPERLPDLAAKAAGRFPVTGSIDDLLALGPDLVIEAAGHGAVRQFGCEVLSRGTDLLLASTGILADAEFTARLVRAAAAGTELWIASGAVAGIDGLLGARTAGLQSVTYTSVKGPHAWQGTAGESLIDPAAKGRHVFFRGTAREAARLYPQNANVGATIALAGLGLDRTRVHLAADPSVAGPLGIIEASGDFGSFLFEILALASPTNPKTSALTGHSIVSAALDGMAFRVLDQLRGQEA